MLADDNGQSQCVGFPSEGLFEDGDYYLGKSSTPSLVSLERPQHLPSRTGGWGRAAIYKQPFASASCFDQEQNGDEEGVDCGGSCSACGNGGYFGCKQCMYHTDPFESLLTSVVYGLARRLPGLRPERGRRVNGTCLR